MNVLGGIFSIFIFFGSFAQAQQILAGPEWEVTNGVIYRGDLFLTPEEATLMTITEPNGNGRDRLTNLIWSRCKTCVFEKLENRFGVDIYKVTFPELDGWWAIINVDPGTVEIQAKPLTVDQWRAYADKIQYYIFDSAQAMQMKVNWTLRSAGHIHFGIKATFGDNRLLFRNFVTAYLNHPELAQGVMEYDIGNAPPLFSNQQVDAIATLLADFDKSSMTIEGFAQRMIDDVQIDNPAGWDPYAKYQALSFLRIIDPDVPADQKTIEVRALRGQRNMTEFVLVLDFFQTWMNHLATVKTPIALDVPLETFTADAAEARFKALVKEIGGDWNRFKKILPKYAVGGETVSDDSLERDTLATAKADREEQAELDAIAAGKISSNMCYDLFRMAPIHVPAVKGGR